MTSAAWSRLNERFWPRGERHDVWMILDGGRSTRVFETLLESSFLSSCLYSGFISRALEASAPYLVQLEYEDRQTKKLLERAWGNNWGVVLRCDARMETLRGHLRSFLIVRDPKGQRLLFRYYDPRVLRVYLPSCTSEELRMFFGPAEQFWTEGEAADELLEFGMDGSKLHRFAWPLNGSERLPVTKAQSGEARSPMRRRPGMLAVRAEQMALFSAAAEKQFEDWMVVHLNKFFAQKCSSLGEERLRELIRYGIRRASSYRVTIRREVCKYIDVMLVLGRDFDKDPKYSWAKETLDADIDPAVKGTSLLSATRAHLRAVAQF